MTTGTDDEYDDITKHFDATYHTLVADLERDRHESMPY
jgi:hypothetical protein